MKKDENFEGYKRKGKLNGGIQYLFKFKNGYGLSVVRHDFSYGSKMGLWEIGFIIRDKNKYKLQYLEEFGDSVMGYLLKEEVESYIENIKKL